MCLTDLNVARGRARQAATGTGARLRRGARAIPLRAGLALALLFCLGYGSILAGCGGSDDPVQTTAAAVTGAGEPDESKAPGTTAPADEPDPEPANDEAAIRRTLTAVLTGSEPAQVCDELVTERYVRRSFGDAAGCEAAQADLKPARRAAVTEVVILPDSVAQAMARPKGGIYEGETLRAELVLDGGVWRLDRLRSNVPVGP